MKAWINSAICPFEFRFDSRVSKKIEELVKIWEKTTLNTESKTHLTVEAALEELLMAQREQAKIQALMQRNIPAS